MLNIALSNLHHHIIIMQTTNIVNTRCESILPPNQVANVFNKLDAVKCLIDLLITNHTEFWFPRYAQVLDDRTEDKKCIPTEECQCFFADNWYDPNAQRDAVCDNIWYVIMTMGYFDRYWVVFENVWSKYTSHHL